MIDTVGQWLPLTSAQRGIWDAHELLPDLPIVIAIAAELDGDLDVALLEKVCREVLIETDFMVRVEEIEGRPMQCLDPRADDPFPVVDLRDEPDPETAAREWMIADYSAGFDVLGGRLIRSAALRVGDRSWRWYLCIHHIVIDGFGAIGIVNRVATVYSALRAGVEPPAPPARTPLAAIVAADRDYRDSTRYRTDRDHWRERAADLPEPIGTGGSGYVAPDAIPHRVDVVIPPDVGGILDGAAERLGTIDSAIIVAAVAAYVSRLGDADDVVLSLPVTTRTTAALRRGAGMLSNVVPIRFRIDAGTTVADLVRDAGTELVGALRHQRYPNADLRADRRSGGPADLGGLYGPTINIINTSSELVFGDLTGGFDVLSTGPIADLAVTVHPEGMGRRTLTLHGNREIHDRADLADHLDRLLRLLRAIASAPAAAAVRAIDPLRPRDHDRLVPARGPRPPAPIGFDALIAEAVRRAPNRPAMVVRTAAGDLVGPTYAEADRLAGGLADRVRAAGAGPDDLVAIALERSPASVISNWAVTRAGAAFVPIDPTYPAERIAHILRDSGAAVGITVAALRDRLPDDVHWIVVDHLPTADSPHTSTPVSPTPAPPSARPVVTPDRAAYVIYTSGSTGLPKGVVVTHAGLVALAAERRINYLLDGQSRVLHNTSPSFDMAIGEQVMALCVSATLVITPADPNPAELTRLIVDGGVTHALLTPTVLARLDPAAVPDLRVLGVGGEAVGPDLVRRWGIGRTMRNGYGPTEGTDIATVAALRAGEPVTIGSAVHGFDLMVLDSRLRPVIPGAVGELYLGGAGLARGYHHRPDLTAGRFVAHPLEPGKRMYRTGDRVSWMPGSESPPRLRYHGRSDDQVKIRGRRVELGEIEATVAAVPGVRQVAVTLRSTPLGDRLIAYLTVEGEGPGIEAVREHCERTLPHPLVPTAFVIVEEFPRTPNGKLDVRRLPEPQPVSRAPYRPARTPTEAAVIAILEDVLDQSGIGIDDSFFALGGDSIAAIDASARLRAAGLGIGTRDIFERRTIQALAEAAESARHPDAHAADGFDGAALRPILPLRTGGGRAPLFCIHPAIGLSWGYRGLAERLRGDRPIFGVQIPGALPDEPRPIADYPTLTAAAQRYAREIRDVQPEGPYLLLGWSLGGLIAHEVACLLRERDLPVVLVVLDTTIPDPERPVAVGSRPADLAAALGLPVHLIPDAEAPGSGGVDPLALLADVADPVDRATISRLFDASTHAHHLASARVPGVFDGDLLLVTAGRDRPSPEPVVTAWQRHIRGEITVRTVDADHWGICGPEVVDRVGAAVDEYLDRYERAGEPVDADPSSPIGSARPNGPTITRGNP
ncbi:non-ribosomal peptide synthetase [Millisia brevis]|uniref:non-ribosomal peptide synthetase n=1 Tax=Millisia brevis TaxID=264148 RepID=UPI00082F0D4C|nr:non-ribosomal peptide synthetase [Millisia brevis]